MKGQQRLARAREENAVSQCLVSGNIRTRSHSEKDDQDVSENAKKRSHRICCAQFVCECVQACKETRIPDLLA